MADYKFNNKEGTSVRQYPGTDITEGGYGWADYLEYVANGGLTDPWQTKEQAFEDKLAEIDTQCNSNQHRDFVFNAVNFYADERSISAHFMTLSQLPSGYITTWKSSDKEADGVNNIYVDMDVDTFGAFSMAFKLRQKALWDYGDSMKVSLKTSYLDANTTADDIRAFDATIGWDAI